MVTALPAKYRITYLGVTGNDVVLEAGPAASAQSILVDATATSGGASDGNGVFEPGETVGIKPSWKNQGTDPISLSGTASNLTGPGAAGLYSIADTDAVYGSMAVNATADCGSNCYSLMVSDPATRPTTHWDANFTETLSTLADPPKVWTLHIGDSFTDVPRTQPFYKKIETVFHTGITAGCAAAKYCPTMPSPAIRWPSSSPAHRRRRTQRARLRLLQRQALQLRHPEASRSSPTSRPPTSSASTSTTSPSRT